MEKKKFLIMLSAIVAAAGVGIGGFTIVRSVRKSNFSPAPKLENTHVHNYVAEVIPATCAQGGYTLYSCDCGDFHKENETACENFSRQFF